MVFNIGQPSSRRNSKSKGLSDYKDGSNLQKYNNGCQQLFLRSLEKPSPVIIVESKMILFNCFPALYVQRVCRALSRVPFIN